MHVDCVNRGNVPKNIQLGYHGQENGEASQDSEHGQTKARRATKPRDQIARIEQWQGKDFGKNLLREAGKVEYR